MWEGTPSWGRRHILKLAGATAAGTVALGRAEAADESDANVSVRFEDQESDGSSVVIQSLYTDVDAEVIIFRSEGDRTRYRVLEVAAETEFTDRTVELDEPIPETQLISVSVQPPEGGFSYGGARATVAVGEPLDEPDGDESESGLELIDADPDAGFNWPYLLYTPSASEAAGNEETESGETDVRPLVVGNSPWRGSPSDAERRVESGRGHIENGRLSAVARELGSPALVALIPSRDEDGSYQNLRLSGAAFDRLDLQVLAMVDDARARLADRPYDVPEAFHVEGFSSNGRFFDKLAALHPERVNAVSAGGNGIAVLPLAELSEDVPTAGEPQTTSLPWPVGVADLPELVGDDFDRDAWFETAHFWYIGAEDQDPENPEEYLHKLYRGSGEPDELIRDVFGSLQVDERFRTSRAIFEHLGKSAEFTAYDGAGHEVTGEMIEDAADFHRRHKHEAFGPQFARAVEWPRGPVTVGEPLGVAVSYENLGTAAATATSALSVDGDPVDTTSVDVAPGESERVELQHSFSSPGEYTVSVDASASESFAVTAEAGDASATADGTGDSGSERDEPTAVDQPGFGLPQAITALGVVGYLIERRLSENE
ncbi:CARDB domain-containing protein [Halobellus sp. GM3]|uniref:CARDB domain-containing protein n=1 Tax=Halobellus sp. GM3 TaxID=3458410 RepID=UPI00403D6079